MATEDRAIRKQLVEFLRGGSAHIEFKDAVKDFPPELYGKRPKGSPHSAWELLEHIRFTLRDLLEFSTNPKYVAPDWPKDYWPAKPEPTSQEDWDDAVRSVEEDLAAFEKLIGEPSSNLYAEIPWGDGQTLLREVLLAGQHTSYHLGQFVTVKKQLTES